MKLIVALAVMISGVSSAAVAEETCFTLGRRQVFSERSERAFILGRETGYPSTARYRYSTPAPHFIDVLATLGFEAMWPDPPRYRGSYCEGYSTQILLMRARELGPDHPYLSALAQNLVRLTRACRDRRAEIEAPEKNWSNIPDPDGWIARNAEDDLGYILAVREYRLGNYDIAKDLFALISSRAASQHRDAARLMEIRSLRELREFRAAHALVGTYKKQAVGEFREWLDQQEDLIARKSNIPEYRIAHLEKVYKRAYGLPIAGEAPGFRQGDAVYDLETYFLYEHERRRRYSSEVMPADWWIRSEPAGGATAFAAVQALSKKYDEIDWIAARHASRAFVRDNSWFAGPDFDVHHPAYIHVTDYAYSKWKTEGFIHWAAIVAARIDENSPYAAEIIGLVSEMQARAKTCDLSRREYGVYTSVIKHAVRLAAMAHDYDVALALMKEAMDNRFYPHTLDEQKIRRAYVNLLMIRGDYDEMRQFKDVIGGDEAADFWLATTPEELVRYGQAHILEFANMLDSEAVLALMQFEDERGRNLLKPQIEKELARILWMRGYVFHDDVLMDRVAPVVKAGYPQLTPYFRHAESVASPVGRRRIFTHMVLKYPGLSPFGYIGSWKRKDDLSQHLSKDRIEGNWWCSGEDRATVQDDEEALADAFFRWRFSPTAPLERYRASRRYGITALPKDSSEPQMIENAWKRFRADYPPFQMISPDTQKRLASLPRASAYLWDETRAWASSPAGIADWILPRHSRLPESLHRVVFSTRTSCDILENGNGETSRAAYTMLHRRYRGSFWAAQTPYWFDKFDPSRRYR